MIYSYLRLYNRVMKIESYFKIFDLFVGKGFSFWVFYLSQTYFFQKYKHKGKNMAFKRSLQKPCKIYILQFDLNIINFSKTNQFDFSTNTTIAKTLILRNKQTR